MEIKILTTTWLISKSQYDGDKNNIWENIGCLDKKISNTLDFVMQSKINTKNIKIENMRTKSTSLF